MSDETVWPEVCLESVAEEVTVGFVGPMTSEYRPSGVPFLRSKNIDPFSVNINDLRYISTEFHQRIYKSRLRPGDVVIVRTGDPGRTAVIPEWLKESNCADLVIVRPSNAINSHYLAYFVNALARHQVSAHTVGAVQQHFNVGSAKQLVLPLPKRNEQDAIVAILRALDSKIEINHRTNHTLETIAQAIFKSWFVDFDPVTAKAAGRKPYGMNEATAALFPDSFEESELGMIPKGWSVSTVGIEYNLTMGQSPPGSTYNEAGEGLPFYQGRTDFMVRFPSRRVYCTAPTRFAEAGDTLVSVRAPVGDVNMASEKCAVGRGVAAIRHKGGGESYTYYAMRSLRQEFDVFEGEGTLFGAVGRTDFEGINVVTPPSILIKKYEEKFSPLDQRIRNNEEESQTLISLRDALLPKLLSGEIRIRQAENLVSEAV